MSARAHLPSHTAPLRPGFMGWIGKHRKHRGGRSLMPVLIQVFAGFCNLDGSVTETEVDSILDFMRYDYPEAVYSELRQIFLNALNQPQDLDKIAADLSTTLPTEDKILLAVQLYMLIARTTPDQTALVWFYRFTTQLGMARQAMDFVYQINTGDAPPAVQLDDNDSTDTALESLRIASVRPCDLHLRSLSEQCSVICFRYQTLILLKNTGKLPVLVRGRRVSPGELCRVYPGERVLLEELILDYNDLHFYFNAKRNLSGTELYLSFGEDGEVEIEERRTRASDLFITFGLSVRVLALRNTDARLNSLQLRSGVFTEASFEDKILLPGQREVALSDLRRRASGEFGGHFRLAASKTDYLVSNRPEWLSPGDILLSHGPSTVGGDVLLKISCNYAQKSGVLEVLRAGRSIQVRDHAVTERAELKDGETIAIGEGQFLRCHFGDRIIEEVRTTIRELVVDGLEHQFGRDTALDGIGFTVRRGEMICVMGPSGCGKSTLMRAIAGQLKPKMGSILMNGAPLYQNLKTLAPYIAYIPHDDTFDPLLTVEENLACSASMRCPQTPLAERQKRIDAKLVELGLSQARHRLPGSADTKNLSGGQRKRLNAGLDMVSIADVFLFDEPTSGLSSKDSEHVMEVIRGLSHNKIVMVSIHQPSLRLFEMFQKAILLDRGGKLVYFGPPRGMMEYFWRVYGEETGQIDVTQPAPAELTPDFVFDVLEAPLRDFSGDLIYEELDKGQMTTARRFPPNFWRDRFEKFKLIEKVRADTGRERTGISAVEASHGNRTALPEPPKLRLQEEWTLFKTSLKRSFLAKLRNRSNLMTTVLEAPLLALLISGVLRFSEGDAGYTFASAFHISTYLFLSLVVAMFLGLTNSADEIIRDRMMLNRERNHNLRLGYYIIGKVITLGFFGLLQCVIYLLVGNSVLQIYDMFWMHLLWMFLSAIIGTGGGLLVSSIVHDAKTAVNIIPLLLIPQIILGGALVKYEEMNRNLDFLYSVRFWGNEEAPSKVMAAAEKSANDENAEDEDGVKPDKPKKKTEGRSPSQLQVPFICEFMPLRWTYEGILITQAKLNPHTQYQEILDRQLKALLVVIKKNGMTDELSEELSQKKDALAKLSGLQGKTPQEIRQKMHLIRAQIDKGTFDAETIQIRDRGKQGIRGDEIYVNRKVNDLMTKAEAEYKYYEKYLPDESSRNARDGSSAVKDAPQVPNIFFAPVKHFFGKTLPTLVLNFWVMLAILFFSLLGVHINLKRQLSKV